MSSDKNLSACGLEEQVHTENVCIDKMGEILIVTITAIIFLFNIIHLSFLFLLRQQKGTVFYITLRVDAVVNILMSAVVNVGTQCGIRKYITRQHPDLHMIITVIAAILYNFKNLIVVFALIERWLCLAKPFLYSHTFFIKRYAFCVCSAAFITIISLLVTYLIPYYYSYAEICFDVGYGVIGMDSPYFYLMLFPFHAVVLLQCTFSILFFLEYSKQRRRQFLSANDIARKQISNYVFVTTLSYSFCYVTATTLFVMAEIGLDIREWAIIPNHMNNLGSILALYICLKEYRNKVKHCCIQLSVQRHANRIRVRPRGTGNSSV